MKFFFYGRHRHRIRAFTLVELLVVIGIIAILAAVTIGGVSSAIRAAKRAKATSTATQIATAVQNYYTEYGIYPVVAGLATDDYYDGVTGGAKWGNLTIALCGNIDPSTGQTATSTIPNTRGVQYLAPTRSDLDTVNHTFQNPFGSSQPAPFYYMVVDTDYSGVLGDSGTKPADFTGSNVVMPGTKNVPGGVAVWSSCDQALANSKSNFWAHTY